jgi:hypothetical protein
MKCSILQILVMTALVALWLLSGQHFPTIYWLVVWEPPDRQIQLQ